MGEDNKMGRNLVTVDLTELSRGLETALTGAAMIFGSLGAGDVLPDAGSIPVSEGAAREEAAADGMKTAMEKGKETVKEEPLERDNGAVPTEGRTSVQDDPSAGRTAQEAPAVTADDITKVIVAKIRQDRGSNEKIAALLRAYGADRVSALPADRYEAFLTDVSRL